MTVRMTVKAKGLLAGAATAIVAALSAPCVALAADDIEIDLEGEASVVAGVSDGEEAGDLDAEITLKSSTVLDNGLEIGAVVGARLDGQQPNRIYGGGRFSSLTIGGARGIGPTDSDAFLQTAYAYARGGFGKIIVGRDKGAARTLAVTAPTIFRAINVNDWRTDLTGINDVHTVNDVTGQATKITYLSPANYLGGIIGGLQLGVS
ncbi:MAG: porin, partial [Pseudomonadota bacterium]